MTRTSPPPSFGSGLRIPQVPSLAEIGLSNRNSRDWRKLGTLPHCSLAEDGQDGIGLERKKEKVVGITRRRN